MKAFFKKENILKIKNKLVSGIREFFCFFRKRKKIFFPVLFFLVLVVGGIFYFTTKKVSAAWWDDSWLYRKSIAVTNNTTVQTNVYISLTLDTSDTTKFQGDCGDLRFSNVGGNSLDYFVVSGCGTASTVFHVNFQTFSAGAQTLYYYYGNPTAPNGFSISDFSTLASNYTVGSLGSEEKSTGPVAFWKFDEGFGTTAQDSTAQNNDGTLINMSATASPTSGWQTEDQCISGKCLAFDGSNDYINVNSSSIKLNSDYTVGMWVRQTAKKDIDFQVSSYGYEDNNGSNAIYVDGVLRHSTGRGWSVTKLDANWNWVESFSYDTYGNIANATSMANYIASLPDGTNVILATQDEPSNNVYNNETLLTQIKLVGGTDSVLRNIAGRSSYLLVGKKGLGASNAYVEKYGEYRGTGVSYDSGDLLRKGINYGLRVKNNKIQGVTNRNYIEADIVENKWQYVVMTYNGSTQRLYLDGKLMSSATVSLASLDTTNLWIGGAIGFSGLIDEPKIFPYARTKAQIQQDYNAGLAGISASEGSSASFGDGTDKWMSEGLVGWWKMDETSWNGTAGEVKDASGNGNNGASVNGTTTGNGKFGSGGIFDASNDYVNMGNLANFQFIHSDSFSMSTWIRTNDTSGFEHIIGKTYGNYRLAKNNGALSFRIDSNGLIAETGSILNTTDWFNVVTVYDGNTKNAKVYVNGKQEASATNTSTDWTATHGDFQIGNSTGESYYFNGGIDEARVYNRALSPAEVRRLYDWAPGPVGHWKMDEKTGTTANDSSGNGNNGTWGGTGSHWTTGKFGGVGSFNGTNDYVGMGNILNMGTSNFSLSAWVKSTSTDTGNNNGIIYKRTINYNYTPGYRINMPNGQFNFHIADGTNFQTLTIGNSGQYNDGTWHFVSAVAVRGSEMRFYIDGVLKGSVAETNIGNVDSSTDLGIGALLGGYHFFNGQIDDVRIYNYARTQEQIFQDMGGEVASSDYQSSNSATAYYKFDEGSGTTANNSGTGGSALNGTLSCTGTGCVNPDWNDAGKFGKGLLFSGSGTSTRSFVNIPSTSSAIQLGTVTGSQISLSAWINPTTETAGLGHWFIRNGMFYDENYGLNLDTGKVNNKYKIAFSYYDGGSFRFLISTNYLVSQDAWSQITAVVSQGQWVKFYVNGKYIETVNWVGSNSVASTTSLGFSYSGSTSQYLNGSLDEVKIFPYALSSDDVRNEFNRGSAVNMASSGPVIAGGSSNSARAEYCPPGNIEGNCASGQNPSPVAEWKMDEGTGLTAKDTSGNNNDGTLTSGPTWSQGKTGKSVKFDGVDDYLQLSSNVTLQNTNWTVSAWTKTGNSEGSVLSNKSGGPAYNAFQISNSKISYFHYNGNWVREYGTSNVADNNWHYLTWANNGSAQTVDLYVDGKWEATVSSSIVGGAGLVDVIGKYWGGDKFFNGYIDNLRIYGYIRTPAQIAYDYNRGGPVGWWKMDECQGNTIFDSSGNGNNGTLTIGGTGTQTAIGTCATTSTAWGNGTSGKFGNSLNFDGTDDSIDTGNGSSLSFGAGDFSVGYWINYKGTTVINLAPSTIVNKASSASGSAGFFSGITTYGGDGSNYGIVFSTTNGSWGSGNVEHTGQYLPSIWYHIVGVRKNNVFSIYKNGQLASSTSKAGFAVDINNALNFKIGNGAWGYFNGQIDDVQIFNYALTKEQIFNLYNGGASLKFGN